MHSVKIVLYHYLYCLWVIEFRAGKHSTGVALSCYFLADNFQDYPCTISRPTRHFNKIMLLILPIFLDLHCKTTSKICFVSNSKGNKAINISYLMWWHIVCNWSSAVCCWIEVTYSPWLQIINNFKLLLLYLQNDTSSLYVAWLVTVCFVGFRNRFGQL